MAVANCSLNLMARPTAPLARFAKLTLAADYTQRGYPRATAPAGFNREYQGHGNTYPLWQVPVFTIAEPIAHLPDFLANTAGVPLCSDALRQFIDTQKDAHDLVHWLPVTLQTPTETQTYHILQLPYRKKVLVIRQANIDEEGFLEGHPPISGPDVGAAKVFTYIDPRPEFRHDVVVRDAVAQALGSSGLTGVGTLQLESTAGGVLSHVRASVRPAKLTYA
jgi:hypothetical protein